MATAMERIRPNRRNRTMEQTNEEERQAIFDECVGGMRLAAIGRQHLMPMAEVHRVLDVVAERMFAPRGLRRQAMLDIERLNHIKAKFWKIAMEEGDPVAASTFIRAQERQATLQGLNFPTGHIVAVSGAIGPVEEGSSTHRLLAAIKLLKAEGGVEIEGTVALPEGAESKEGEGAAVGEGTDTRERVVGGGDGGV